MTKIVATRPKECTECKIETVVRKVETVVKNRFDCTLVLTTECHRCKIEYTSIFRLPPGEEPAIHAYFRFGES